MIKRAGPSNHSLQPGCCVFLVVVAVALSLVAQQRSSAATENLTPERTVAGQTLISERDPRVRLTFDKQFKYVGAQRFPLYQLADAEQHFFVDAGTDHKIRRWYWIQFEQYLPSRPDAHHDYSKSESHTDIGGWPWYVDGGVSHPLNAPSNPESDGAHARAYLKSKGYAFPGDMGQVRLVYLTDDTRRKELMIIYEEDMARTGTKASAVEEDNAPGHATFRDLMLERAKQGMKVEPQ